jgi:hypothetical protein
MTFSPIPTGELFSNHIAKQDGELLTDLAQSKFASVCVAEFDTGWFVQVGVPIAGDLKEAMEANAFVRAEYDGRRFSPEFRSVVRAAQAEGLAFLRIHVDAEPTEGLTTFDW